MKQRWRTAVLIVLIWASTGQAQQANWQFRWHKGQVLTYKAEHKTNVEEVAEGSNVAELAYCARSVVMGHNTHPLFGAKQSRQRWDFSGHQHQSDRIDDCPFGHSGCAIRTFRLRVGKEWREVGRW